MKKRIKSLLICLTIVLSIGMASYAALADCHHDFNERSESTYDTVTYSTSMYVVKNGRKDWWPIIVTEKYEILHFRCTSCKKAIPEMDVWRLTYSSWKFAY